MQKLILSLNIVNIYVYFKLKYLKIEFFMPISEINDTSMINGKWMNKNTGEIVTVFNSIIDGDDMLIITDKGQISMKDFDSYIQIHDEDINQNTNNEQNDNSQISNYDNSLNDEISEALKPKQNIISNNDFDKVIKNETKYNKSKSEKEINPILKNFFDKAIENNNLKIDIKIDLDMSELNIIMKYMDMPSEDIANYIYENIINKDMMIDIIKKQL